MNRFNIGDQFKDNNSDVFTVLGVENTPKGPNYKLNSFKGYTMTLPEKEIISSLDNGLLKWYFMTMRTSLTNKIAPKQQS
jgi:hypothetical protein